MELTLTVAQCAAALQLLSYLATRLSELSRLADVSPAFGRPHSGRPEFVFQPSQLDLHRTLLAGQGFKFAFKKLATTPQSHLGISDARHGRSPEA